MDIDEENKFLRDIVFSIYHKIKDAKPYEDTRYRMQWVLISDFLIEEIIGYCKPKIKRFGDVTDHWKHIHDFHEVAADEKGNWVKGGDE